MWVQWYLSLALRGRLGAAIVWLCSLCLSNVDLPSSSLHTAVSVRAQVQLNVQSVT